MPMFNLLLYFEDLIDWEQNKTKKRKKINKIYNIFGRFGMFYSKQNKVLNF